MRVEQYCVGDVGTNCYFAINEETGEMLVIDPGDSAGMLAGKIREGGWKPQAVLLTHGHFDHAMAAEELAGMFGIQVYAHEAEKETLEQPRLNVSAMIGRRDVYHADVFVKDGQALELAGMECRVLHTPGHTEGGCCYYFEEAGILVAGDTIFQESVGRTDLATGSMSALVRSIRDKLFVLPDETKVYPGHGESTTIEHEKAYNPFVQ